MIHTTATSFILVLVVWKNIILQKLAIWNHIHGGFQEQINILTAVAVRIDIIPWKNP